MHIPRAVTQQQRKIRTAPLRGLSIGTVKKKTSRRHERNLFPEWTRYPTTAVGDVSFACSAGEELRTISRRRRRRR